MAEEESPREETTETSGLTTTTWVRGEFRELPSSYALAPLHYKHPGVLICHSNLRCHMGPLEAAYLRFLVLRSAVDLITVLSRMPAIGSIRVGGHVHTSCSTLRTSFRRLERRVGLTGGSSYVLKILLGVLDTAFPCLVFPRWQRPFYLGRLAANHPPPRGCSCHITSMVIFVFALEHVTGRAGVFDRRYTYSRLLKFIHLDCSIELDYIAHFHYFVRFHCSSFAREASSPNSRRKSRFNKASSRARERNAVFCIDFIHLQSCYA